MIEYYKELLYYIKNKIPNKDYAQDIVQETYTKIIAIQSKQEIINKRALLYKVAKNIIIDKARKNKNIQEITYEENEYSTKNQEPETIVLEENRKKILMNELQKLPPLRKEAFVLHILEGYSKQEVANIMSISVQSVEKHISRASIDLREKLKRKEEL